MSVDSCLYYPNITESRPFGIRLNMFDSGGGSGRTAFVLCIYFYRYMCKTVSFIFATFIFTRTAGGWRAAERFTVTVCAHCFATNNTNDK